MAKLPEIPSEFIEPYLAAYFGSVIQSVGYGFKSVAEAKHDLAGVERFISQFGGIHSRLATANEYFKVLNMNNKRFKRLCSKVVKEHGEWKDYE